VRRSISATLFSFYGQTEIIKSVNLSQCPLKNTIIYKTAGGRGENSEIKQ
jgi:hypothetical protein